LLQRFDALGYRCVLPVAVQSGDADVTAVAPRLAD
jgi:hypothetical protein